MNAVCEVCGAIGYEHVLLCCRDCKGAHTHQYCLKKVLYNSPKEGWCCDECNQPAPEHDPATFVSPSLAQITDTVSAAMEQAVDSAKDGDAEIKDREKGWKRNAKKMKITQKEGSNMIRDIMAKQDRVKIRFSTNRLKKLCVSLKEEQKDFVRANGFKNFLDLSVFSVPIPLLEWLMTHFQLGVKEFQYGNKTIRFTKAMVEQVFGFTSGDIPVCLDIVSPKLIEEANSFHADYIIGGSKPSIAEAIKLCQNELNEDAFMRNFMLVALSTMICPNTQNSIDLSLLSYLMRPAEIRKYDWATFAFDYLTKEVERFQKHIYSSDAHIRDGSHWYGSCLPLLVVAYMDFLDLNTEFGNAHMISYDLPRFCHVKTEDFSYIADADCVRYSSSKHMEFGIVPFRTFSSTPYHVVVDDIGVVANLNEVDDDIMNNALDNPIADDDDIEVSMGAQGEKSSSGDRALSSIAAFDVPTCIEPIVRQHYENLLSEVTSILASANSSPVSVRESLAAVLSKCLSTLSCDVCKLLSSSTAGTSILESLAAQDKCTSSQKKNNDDNVSKFGGDDIYEGHSHDNDEALGSKEDKSCSRMFRRKYARRQTTVCTEQAGGSHVVHVG